MEAEDSSRDGGGRDPRVASRWSSRLGVYALVLTANRRVMQPRFVTVRRVLLTTPITAIHARHLPPHKMSIENTRTSRSQSFNPAAPL